MFFQRLAPRFELRAQAKEINPGNFRHARRRAKAIEEVEIGHRELISRKVGARGGELPHGADTLFEIPGDFLLGFIADGLIEEQFG